MEVISGAVSCHWQPSRALLLQSTCVLHPVEVSPMMIHFQGGHHTKHCLSKQNQDFSLGLDTSDDPLWALLQ